MLLRAYPNIYYRTVFILSQNPPGPAGLPPLARGTFTLPPLLKGGAATAAEGFKVYMLILLKSCTSLFLCVTFLFYSPSRSSRLRASTSASIAKKASISCGSK